VAALLARAGVEVTVLEAHVYPGGCAGTFVHRGYRFDAGATLAGGFAAGGPMARLAQRLHVTWPAEPAQPAMAVHLPDGARVLRWTDPLRWRAERLGHFGAAGEPFWAWQEGAADAVWALAARLPPWPAQTGGDVLGLLRALAGARPIARAVPALHAGARLVLPGTPVTFRRYTRRPLGWVGGYPQTDLWRARGPRLGRGLWLVGDSVFPGQSTAAVALGGMRVVAALLGEGRQRQAGAP
jgi:phytoene dehydrogenase-like protein